MNYRQVKQHSKVVALARRSTDETKQQDSIESQRTSIESFCDTFKLNLDRSFANDGIIERDGSGLTAEREDIDAVIKHCKLNGITQLLVNDISRLTRQDSTDAGDRLKSLVNSNIDLILGNRLPQLFDLDDHDDHAVIMDLIKVAHLNSRNTAEAVIRSKRGRADRMVMPPPESFGIKVFRDKETSKDVWWVVPDKEKLEILRQAGLMLIDGVSGTKITTFMNESGFTTFKGCPWTYQTLKRTLSLRIYAGDYQHFKWRSGKLKTAGKGFTADNYKGTTKKGSSQTYKLRMETQPEENWTLIVAEEQKSQFVFVKEYVNRIYDTELGKEVDKSTIRIVTENEEDAVKVESNTTVPCRIFSREEFDAIQVRIKAKSGTKKRTRENTKHLFTGFLTCGCCGGPMIARMSTTKAPYIYYFCYTQRNATIKRLSNMKRGCNGGAKTIKEDELIENVFLDYYTTCAEHPDMVLSKCKEKLKSLLYSEEYHQKQEELRNLHDYCRGIAMKYGKGSYQYLETERLIEGIEADIENMPLRISQDIPRYVGDEMSLTSSISAALIDGDSDKVQKKAVNLLLDRDNLKPSREFITDVVDTVTVHYHIGEGNKRNRVSKLVSSYRVGFDSTSFFTQEAFTEHLAASVGPDGQNPAIQI